MAGLALNKLSVQTGMRALAWIDITPRLPQTVGGRNRQGELGDDLAPTSPLGRVKYSTDLPTLR